MTAAVVARELRAGYGGQEVLHGIDIHVDQGEVVALLGANGAGKTTTLLALAGVIRSSGSVELFGASATGPLHARARRGLAFLPESRAIIRRLTVAENMRLTHCDVARATGISPELSPLLNRRVALLSGGEQQILSLTMAIARDPQILMADELSFGLSPLIVNRMLELTRVAADNGAAVLLVEQFAAQVLRIADRGYVLRRGTVATEGTAADLLGRLDDIEASYLGGTDSTAPETIATSNTRKDNDMLDGKTIVVTGCASGIGEETAAELKRQGATVIGVDRNPAVGVDEFHQADLSDPGTIDALVETLPSGINGLCNIAGLPPTAPAAEVLKVNALGLEHLTLGLIDKLADGASITNLASMAGIGWMQAVDQLKEFADVDFDSVQAFAEKHDMDQGGRSYFFSKEAVVAWTFANRWTWRDRGIRMNSVSPGPVDTPILPDFIETLGERAEEDMKIMDRPGLPTDIAPVVAFLQSDASAWFRGANLTPDGGMSSHIMLHMTGMEA